MIGSGLVLDLNYNRFVILLTDLYIPVFFCLFV